MGADGILTLGQAKDADQSLHQLCVLKPSATALVLPSPRICSNQCPEQPVSTGEWYRMKLILIGAENLDKLLVPVAHYAKNIGKIGSRSLSNQNQCPKPRLEGVSESEYDNLDSRSSENQERQTNDMP
ncbi:hypothetical protein E5288_WYG010903 [Bos mutus]|uniref:Uncharacterized protein n=1 Tax=Bos mutus TaxID=72004 RepID=A0A6B0QZL6_9CETA|nr:hypothetical protein [Bos mutus]